MTAGAGSRAPDRDESERRLAEARRKEERLAEALRANLRRRKDQARGRVIEDTPRGEPSDPPQSDTEKL